MEAALVKTPEKKPIEKLSVVRNFRQVIEARDISLMQSELYQFVILHCGFIAHFNLSGFKTTYSCPKDFAGVFIRHFDRSHSYFCNTYRCDEVTYRGTGYTVADIKQEFYRLVDAHIEAVAMWAEGEQRRERLAAPASGSVTLLCRSTVRGLPRWMIFISSWANGRSASLSRSQWFEAKTRQA